jgi:hypothetical protein
MENLHTLEVTYLGATNSRGSRVKIFSPRFDQSVVIPFDYEFNDIAEIAAAYLLDKGFEIIGRSQFKNGYFLISRTFEPLK